MRAPTVRFLVAIVLLALAGCSASRPEPAPPTPPPEASKPGQTITIFATERSQVFMGDVGADARVGDERNELHETPRTPQAAQPEKGGR